MSSRRYHTGHLEAKAHSNAGPSSNHHDNDPLSNHVDPHHAHNMHTKSITGTGGSSHVPTANLIKQLTNFADMKLPLQSPLPTNVFQTSQSVDFQFNSVVFDTCLEAAIRITVENTSAYYWPLPNLYLLFDHLQFLMNGADADDQYDGYSLLFMAQALAKNLDANAKRMHFHGSEAPEGLRYLPKNQVVRTTVSDNTAAPIAFSAVGPATTNFPTSIPSAEPLCIPPGESRSFDIDVTFLPLFSGNVYFPAIKDIGTRLRLWFRTDGGIIGDSTYANLDTTVGLTTRKNYEWLELARQAGQLKLTFAEMRMTGNTFSQHFIKEELHAKHQNFMFRQLIPRKYILTQPCASNTKVAATTALSSLKGMFSFWHIVLRDIDAEYAPRKGQWIDSIQSITEKNSDGTTRDYDDKEAVIFSNVVDSTRFQGGNNYFGSHADFGQFMFADPVNRGAVDALTGAAKVIGADNTQTKPYYATCGRDKRAIAFCFSSNPLKDFLWGTQYGSQYYDGFSSIQFTPGPDYTGFDYPSTQKQLVFYGYLFTTLHFNGKKWLSIKHQ